MRTILNSSHQGVNEHIYAKEDTTDVTDFSSFIPDMKRKFHFDRDDFQKRAVYRIEQ